MTSVGPICHLPPATDTKSQPGPQTLPSVPPAQPNIASLTATVNALRQAVNYLAGRQGVKGSQGQINNFTTKQNDKKSGRWTEQARTTEKVKVYQNNDNTSQNWVEVERINQLKMKDSVTGEVWTWDRERR
jgi:hypothetical protein